MLEVLGAVMFLLLLGISIGLHELGHLVPAKAFGVKVTEFAIGFGPAVWKSRIGETNLRIRLLPLGGFIRMIGMYPPSRQDGRRVGGWFAHLVDDARASSAAEIEPGDEQRTFYRLSTPKRLLVMIGGPAMNLALAAVFFAICLTGIGVQEPSNQLANIVPCVPTVSNPDGNATAGNSKECIKTPATEAGLLTGDKIVRINGVQIADWSGVQTALGEMQPGEQISLTYLRGSTENSINLVAADYAYQELDATGKPTGNLLHRAFIGIAPEWNFRPLPITTVPSVMWGMTTASVQALTQFPAKILGLAQGLINGEQRDPNGPVSVVGITRIGGEIAASEMSLKSKVFDMLSLAASLNLFLFLFNLLPLLPLDGGHAAGAIFESVRRRFALLRRRPDPGPIDIARALPLTYAMSILLLASGVIVIIADIIKPISLGG